MANELSHPDWCDPTQCQTTAGITVHGATDRPYGVDDGRGTSGVVLARLVQWSNMPHAEVQLFVGESVPERDTIDAALLPLSPTDAREIGQWLLALADQAEQ